MPLLDDAPHRFSQFDIINMIENCYSIHIKGMLEDVKLFPLI